jgi:phage terminase large subunit-like protein
MRKVLFVAALMASASVQAVDIGLVARAVTTYENGTIIPPERTVQYVWFQGQTPDDLRQVGVTPGPAFHRLGQSDTNHCFAVVVQVLALPTEAPSPLQSERSVTVCRDFTSAAGQRPARSEIVTLERRVP